MKIVDFPSFVPIEKYQDLVERIIQIYKENSCIQSIYQIGSIKNPGISDLDILLVLNNSSTQKSIQMLQLNETEKLILKHNFLAIPSKDIQTVSNFNFFTNYKLLLGEEMNFAENTLSNEVRTQIALEYMLMFYISLYRQFTFKSIKLRAFLLEAKAIEFDLKLLYINSKEWDEMITKINFIRSNYFELNYTSSQWIKIVKDFYLLLENELNIQLKKNNFFIPKNNVKISKNIELIYGESFKIIHKSKIIFKTLPNINAKQKLQTKFSKFHVTIPKSNNEENILLRERFNLFKEINETIKQYGDFIPLTSKMQFRV